LLHALLSFFFRPSIHGLLDAGTGLDERGTGLDRNGEGRHIAQRAEQGRRAIDSGAPRFPRGAGPHTGIVAQARFRLRTHVFEDVSENEGVLVVDTVSVRRPLPLADLLQAMPDAGPEHAVLRVVNREMGE
jgi:hypothetical protein